MHSYIPKGVCAREIFFDIDKDIVKNVRFVGGCSGNLQGIAKLVEGMPVAKVIERLKNIDCNNKGTSCPDQLSKALQQLQTNQ